MHAPYYCTGNQRIWRLSENDTLTLVAGDGGSTFDRATMDHGPATSASLGSVRQLAVDLDGNIVFAERTANFVWRVNVTAGTIAVIGGTGQGVTSGDGGQALLAGIERPAAIATDALGNVYVAEFAVTADIRRIAPDGIITTAAGTGTLWCMGADQKKKEGGGNGGRRRETEQDK